MTEMLPRSLTLNVSVGAQCHVGKERTENQDRITRAATPFGDLFVVADGVGGYAGGAEAAEVTAEGFASYLSTHGDRPVHQALQEAATAVGEELRRRAAADNSRSHAASTVVLCIVQEAQAICAHVGDSRAYLVRQGKMRQLTRDHSVTERLISQGLLDPAHAREHPDASVLTRVLGQAGAELDIAELDLQPGDSLLLCSDGLWGYAEDSQIETVAAAKDLSAQQIADALLDLALEGGGGDNISIQFIHLAAASSDSRLTGRARRMVAPAIGLAALLAAGTGTLLITRYRHSDAENQPLPSAQPAPVTPVAKEASRRGGDEPKTDVVVVDDGDGAAVQWAERLRTMPWLAPPRVERGGDECLVLEEEKPVLYYAAAKQEIAQRTARTLHEKPELAEIGRDDLSACGGRELIMMPGLAGRHHADRSSTPNPVGSGVEAVGDAARRKVSKGAERVLHPHP